MKVRFISTFEPATSFYRDLLPHLVESGFEVELLISKGEYRSGRSSLADELRARGVVVTQVRTGIAEPKGAAQKVMTMAAFLFGATRRTLLGPGADLNVFFSTPPFFAAWGMALRVLRGQRYACVIQDVYPDILVLDAKLRPSGVGARLLGALSRQTWRRASRVIVIGRCMAELIERRGVDPARIELIPNWGHSQVGAALAGRDTELRRQLGAEDRFVVLYAGNLGVSHTFDEILEVARQFTTTRPEVLFVFVGAGSRRGEVEAAKARDGVDNVVLLPFQPAERLADTLATADVHLVTLRPGFEGVVVPSKAYTAIATGRPVVYVGRSAGEIARLITETGVGVAITPGDITALAAAIGRYANGCRAGAAGDGPPSAPGATMSHSLEAWASVLTV